MPHARADLAERWAAVPRCARGGTWLRFAPFLLHVARGLHAPRKSGSETAAAAACSARASREQGLLDPFATSSKQFAEASSQQGRGAGAAKGVAAAAAAAEEEEDSVARLRATTGYARLEACTQRAGDLVYIPGMWHHATVSLSESVGIFWFGVLGFGGFIFGFWGVGGAGLGVRWLITHMCVPAAYRWGWHCARTCWGRWCTAGGRRAPGTRARPRAP
jgi:hypothetical protein